MKLAGGAALNGLAQDGFLIDGTGGQLLVDIVEAQTVDGIGKALAGDTLVTEQQNCLFDNIHNFFFTGENLGQRLAMGNLLAPAAANIDLKAVLIFLKCTEGALAGTTAAVVTCIGIDADLAVNDLSDLDGAGLHYLALLTATALGVVDHGNSLADDTQVVQAGLSAVIGTTADADLELVRQGDTVVADVELLVDLFGQTVGIGQAVLAGGTLTGDNRTNQRTGTASGQAMLSQEIDQRLNILMLDALDFQSQTGSHGNSTGTKLLCSLCHSTMLIGSDLTIASNDTNIEYVGVALILQAAQTLDALDLLGRQNTAFELNLYLVCEQTAFQSQGVGVAVCLQTVLQEVATLTLSADQQQLSIQIQAAMGPVTFARSIH